VQDFGRPAVRSGSKAESTVFGLMSASAGCGHCVAHGYVGEVPLHYIATR